MLGTSLNSEQLTFTATLIVSLIPHAIFRLCGVKTFSVNSTYVSCVMVVPLPGGPGGPCGPGIPGAPECPGGPMSP